MRSKSRFTTLVLLETPLSSDPCAIALYASRPLSPGATQHSLPSGRYPLLGPVFHRLDRTSLPGALIQSPRRHGQAASAADCGVFSLRVDHGDRMASRECDELFAANCLSQGHRLAIGATWRTQRRFRSRCSSGTPRNSNWSDSQERQSKLLWAPLRV